MNSKVSKFHLKTLEERLDWLADATSLNEEDVKNYQNFGILGEALADRMIENTIGIMEIPLGLAVNFVVNGKDVVIPMAVEESSVVAAASHGAKLARSAGGFYAMTTEPLMFSQIQLLHCRDPFGAKMRILENKETILHLAGQQDPLLLQLGGGPQDLEVRVLDVEPYPMVIVHLIVNVLDAMGANTANTMAESIAPMLESLSGGRANLKIISNLADQRLARVRCTVKKEELHGEETVDRIVSAYRFAALDPYRAATHNKGIMNGISAVVLATGNDTRAVEAGAHAYAARSGRYTSLSVWEKNQAGDLVGTLELPMAVGIIGGATAVHPKVKSNLKILGIESAKRLAEIIASVGLAQNLTALRALASEGIQKGHMKLHAKNIAMMAGAVGAEIDQIAQQMIEEGKIQMDRAKQLVGNKHS
ncbi:hydroxymethylglutaryl-CoA reductase, degradative [Ammoniphilus sp. 3BR4]|uniref:hydroxymethylglutaryl-CoA reductase, degradative n=1 Tax=Ammoniphilus sp. 3BR4 TaxID=3158265 RepID=UPI0034678D10